MTGKVIDSGANSILLVLLPLALITMVVFVFWPLLVGIFFFTLGYKLWQRYRFKQLSEQVDPFFNQLIQVHQGCITVVDLTNKTNLSANTARWYLEEKTQEYGAVKRLYEDKGIVYYFLTANALGSIFDDSEPDDDTDLAPESNLSTSFSNPTTVVESPSPEVKSLTDTPELSQTFTTTVIPPQPSQSVFSNSPLPPNIEETDDSPPTVETLNNAVTQSELAKRLEVHPSTVGKRKSEADFSLWSQSRDPEGISWKYVEETKLFIPDS
ncbi:hypothetical protein [Geminocystis sp. GBBB08]|uniref:hypothetical protein n=1 Tax=Geminocystis sp. GBBB08 TaxID=2604140 RepID=UPI0027E2CC9E|nr:hypothetical protein [Geminocystis sp. GBBB08]MBL1210235.1 hypothetical protein [Geminocystis sp. GBBB08]